MPTLAELFHAGTLATQYDQVPALLAGLDGAELVKAGNLLARLDPDSVTAETCTVTITGHGTLNALVPAFTAELARHGILARTTVSDFDSYVFDLSTPTSEVYRSELVLCVLDPFVVLDEVPTPWRPDDVRTVLDEKLALLAQLAGTYAKHGSGTLVFNTIPLPRDFAGQLVDLASRAELGALWREANARLLRLMADNQKLVVLDLDLVLGEGIALTDPRMSVYAKAHLSPALLARYAKDTAHLARQVKGHGKKVLALDLDETVWGGVLGDDGIDGIEVAESYRGEAFRAFQRVARQIGAQGVLLAAVSKNDLDPVQAALRDHPDMTLREDDFVRVSANWRPKPENLAELAADLNLGIDSFVFADDSPYECGLVRHELPGVAVVQLDGEPALHIQKVLRDDWFVVRDLTAEDAQRPARYRDELVRKDFLASFESIEEYLAQLGVTVRIAPAEPREIPRVSQITLRTNQFNLTTERLQPADVTALTEDPACAVLAVHAGDRFGDNGLVGVLFLRREGETLHIDNFLLSCRVFSRGVEQTCLATVLAHARDTGCAEVLGSYRPSAKNGKVAELYPSAGFTPWAKHEDVTVFRHDLAEIGAAPRHVTLTVRIEESA
ncbi:HAD-IIIC family phosphatase [Actinocrispum sp. NPDC049592]|uniref:HAD-IIIC family phosphatase n=1 Tax=Actinocrispum sp. NPDC049592 TaxID=3154835 RepID=UPI0034215888